MALHQIVLSVTTDGSGDGSAQGTESLSGGVYAVQLGDGDFADGVDVTITFEDPDLSIPVLIKANFNTDQMVYPRVAEALNTDGSALTNYTMPLASGFPKVVIAQGGAATTGKVKIYVIDL